LKVELELLSKGNKMKKILITGKDSYIGTSFEKWMNQWPDAYEIDTLDVKTDRWINTSFRRYDVIIHVAAIVHLKSDIVEDEIYYKVNTILPVSTAEKAKKEGVKQFVFLSTMAVFGEDGSIGKSIIIDSTTKKNPRTIYGKSKAAAEESLIKLNTEKFRILLVRPPMIYGKGCKGNYRKLVKVARKVPIFPMIKNQRSMLDINRFVKIIKEYIDYEYCGITHPQDKEYKNTSILVKEISVDYGHSLYLSKFLGKLVIFFLGKNEMTKKVFGNLVYKYERREVFEIDEE